MKKTRTHPLRSARLSLQRPLTQKQLADFAGVSVSTIERAERGEPIRIDCQQRICAYLNRTPEQLGLLKGDEKGQVLLVSQDTKSHDLDSGIPSTPLSLQEVENLFARRTARLQGWLVDSLEGVTRLRWQLYYTSSNTLTEDGLPNQIMKLEQLADDGGKDHARICRVLAQNYQLAGSLARDKFHYHTAENYFCKALQVADETQLPDMRATAIARHALVLLRQERIERALKLYRDAVDVAKHAEPYTKAYVVSGLAEALARNGYGDECYRTLDQAEQLLDRVQHVPLEEDFAYVRLTMQSLQDSRGECHVLLGEPVKGLEYLLIAQQQLDHKMSRNYCRLLMQQSEAFLVADQPDQSVQHALKGLQIAHVLESTSNINWSHEIYAKLFQSRWRNESVVAELRAAISV